MLESNRDVELIEDGWRHDLGIDQCGPQTRTAISERGEGTPRSFFQKKASHLIFPLCGWASSHNSEMIRRVARLACSHASRHVLSSGTASPQVTVDEVKRPLVERVFWAARRGTDARDCAFGSERRALSSPCVMHIVGASMPVPAQ